MAYHWTKCPYCGYMLEHGPGRPAKRLGDPIKTCRMCRKSYLDPSIIDWSTASTFDKILYYFANGRFIICLLPYLIAVAIIDTKLNWEPISITFFACLPVFAIVFALCALYVRHQVKAYYIKKHQYIRKEKEISPQEQYKKYQNGMFDNKK